jgi:hypothetical protein
MDPTVEEERAVEERGHDAAGVEEERGAGVVEERGIGVVEEEWGAGVEEERGVGMEEERGAGVEPHAKDAEEGAWWWVDAEEQASTPVGVGKWQG